MTQQSVTDTVLAEVATRAAYTSGAATVVAGVTLGEWAAAIGIVMTVATFLANLFFKFRLDRREQLEHEQRMQDAKAETEAEDE